MKTIFLFFTFFAISITLGYSQYPSNSNFDGNTGPNTAPFGWVPCHSLSTLDTQPGAWNVTKKASSGDTYTNLVTRGNLGPYANTTEDMSSEIIDILTTDKKYKYSIDLAISESWGHMGV